jgi:putative NADPH-quinone reductase
MVLLVVVAHPSRESFNRAIADTVARTLREAGHSVLFHDLYEEGFAPVLPTGGPRRPLERAVRRIAPS